jgi:signal transduction histidine kinase
VQLAYYRIVQEALNNIGKHSQANLAWVNLECDDARAVLRIVDNGIGFQIGQDPPDHLGLQSMRERAEAIGAQLTITSRPQSGTTIAVEWQFPKAAPEVDPAVPGDRGETQ